ncbi:hypothetical protein [Serratia marcescens]|uniref:hypothetical protein n=1 Tax=Serratia marcescens TaxID=615 RepID=UPI0012B5169D|nr:hypothetical protein [Serratia marcescens]WLS21636.1 hypothetical protein RAA91_10945 [Serratia marcescens]WLS21689.1 hypothetical protein RAA91_11240 [Serratia marcescens]HCB1443910.1 hypothetical protein [Serratia marcescens]HCB1485802.1 hypothetical protein [Serratia marcescens]HCB1615440.1 hypothetical protein [Serratia marcescens]
MNSNLNKLKRRAEKCPIQRFKPFIGKSNTQATLCADTGIEIIGWSGYDSSDLNTQGHRIALARYISAADPKTILDLIKELKAKDKTLELEQEKSRRVMSENHQQAQRIAELEAMLAQPVNHSYKLVPVEPTAKQWAAGAKAMDSGIDKVTLVYKAMLKTAPTQGENQ